MLSQVQLLSYIINNKDYSVIRQNNLNDKFFFNYKAEFNFIKNHYERYQTVPDKLTFLNTFPDFDLVEVNEPLAYLLEQIYKDYNMSYLATRFNKIKPMLENDRVEDAVEYFMKSVDGIQKSSVVTCSDILKDTSRYDRYLEKSSDQGKYYISTGFKELDMIIGGIDVENEDLCIVSRPGQGKTYVMLAMVCAALKQGKKVLMYEGEMSKDKIMFRIDTLLSHIKNTSLNRGDLFVQKDYKRHIDMLSGNSGLGEFFLFTPNDVIGDVTVDTIESMAEQVKPDIIFIDQYSLMEDKNHARVEFERVGNIAKDIKKLQVKLRKPIISISQQNRTKNENGELDTTQVAGSDKIPQYVTTLIMLEQKYKEETKTVELTFHLSKVRDGGDHNKLTYQADLNTGIFSYIPTADDKLLSKEDFEKIRNDYSVTSSNEGNIF